MNSIPSEQASKGPSEKKDTRFAAGLSPRQLDAFVYEKVFGFPVTWLRTALSDSAPHYSNSDEGSGWLYCRLLSSDMGAAMSVVREVQRRHPGWRFSLLGGDTSMGYIDNSPRKGVDENSQCFYGWSAEFFGEADPRINYGDRHGTAHNIENPARAICLAALEAISTTQPSGKAFFGADPIVGEE